MKFYFNREPERTYDIEIKDGPYSGKYKAIKHYTVLTTFTEVKLEEFENTLNVHKSFDIDDMTLTKGTFFATTDKSKIKYFAREYNISDSVLENQFKDTNIIFPKTRNTKPVHIDRIWEDDTYHYEINEYSQEEFLRNTKFLTLNNYSDMKRIFERISDKFGMDLSMYLENAFIAKETNYPYTLKVYGKNKKPLVECIVDKSDKSDYLIINHLLSDERFTMVFRKDFDKEKAELEYSYMYTIDKDIKNPLLNRNITEFNNMPLLLKYDKDHMIISHENNDTTVETNLDNIILKQTFYPATWRFNRDHIFGSNLFYRDLITVRYSNFDSPDKYDLELTENALRRLLYVKVGD